MQAIYGLQTFSTPVVCKRLLKRRGDGVGIQAVDYVTC